MFSVPSFLKDGWSPVLAFPHIMRCRFPRSVSEGALGVAVKVLMSQYFSSVLSRLDFGV